MKEDDDYEEEETEYSTIMGPELDPEDEPDEWEEEEYEEEDYDEDDE